MVKSHRKRKSVNRSRSKKSSSLSMKVKKILSRSSEHKQNEYTFGAVPYATAVPIIAGANVFTPLSVIAQGTDNSNRIGDQVTGYVHIKGMIRNTSATNSYVARMSVVTDTAQSNTISANVVPVQSNIYVSATDLFSDEFQKQKRYNVIKRKVVNLGPSISGSANFHFNFRLPKRLLNWTAGSTAATDMSKGMSYILFESEAAAVLQYTFNAVTYFTDM